MDLIDVLAILGFGLRLLGAAVFGVAAGWLVLQAFKPEFFHWPLAVAAILGLFATFALIGYWVDGGGTLGAFGLGAGSAILIWPLASRQAAAAEKGKESSTRKR